MGLFSKIFRWQDSVEQKDRKFQELEQTLEGDEEMISNSKASWLTSRGNHNGGRGEFDKAVADFEEAIRLKKDHLPAHLGLAIAYEKKGMHEKAVEILDSAPEEMKLHGKVMATKKETMSNMIGM